MNELSLKNRNGFKEETLIGNKPPNLHIVTISLIHSFLLPRKHQLSIKLIGKKMIEEGGNHYDQTLN